MISLAYKETTPTIAQNRLTNLPPVKIVLCGMTKSLGLKTVYT